MSRKNEANSQRLNEVLDDLCMRFLVNLPAVEYESFERLFFAIESAHWFYDDFYREHDKSLPRLQLKQFASRLFKHTALLHHYHNDVDKLTAQFQSYKQEVPTCGAALLNPAMDKVVVVRGWGQNARWGFPKGKLSKDETELEAAIREVLEETGFDMAPQVDGSTPYVDSMSGGRYSRIFMVTDVPETTVFRTKTRKEISDIKWVSLLALPESPKAAKVQQIVLLTASGPERTEKAQKIFFSQYGVAPYTKRLRSWVARQKETLKQKQQQSQQDIPASVTPESWGQRIPDCNVQAVPAAPMADRIVPRPKVGITSPEAKVPPQHIRESINPVRAAKGRAKLPDANKKESARKSRRKVMMAEHEDVLNRTTFGTTGGSRMNDSERDKLFREYVIETDKIAAEKGLQDEFWPVPYVTSKDFASDSSKTGEKPDNDKMALQKILKEAPVPRETNDLFSSSFARKSSFFNNWAQKNGHPRKHDKFSFDREAIMASLISTRRKLINQGTNAVEREDESLQT